MLIIILYFIIGILITYIFYKKGIIEEYQIVTVGIFYPIFIICFVLYKIYEVLFNERN